MIYTYLILTHSSCVVVFFFSSRRRHTRFKCDWNSDVCFFDSSRRRHTRFKCDWSSDVCSSDLTGELEHKVEAVEAWVAELGRRFGHRPIAVAVEQVKGALVFLLNKYECLHIFPVPSTMTAKMREALYPSGAQDDPRDADLLLDILGQHRDKLHRLSP